MKNKCKTCKREFYHKSISLGYCSTYCKMYPNKTKQVVSRSEERMAWERFWEFRNSYNSEVNKARIPDGENDQRIWEWCNMKMKDRFINNKGK